MAALGDDLLRIVNQLQDLVFNTIGTDSLDLPQIVRHSEPNLSNYFFFPFYVLPSARTHKLSTRSLSVPNQLESPRYLRISSDVTFCLEAAALSLVAL